MRLPSLYLNDGSVEVLKWLGLSLMTFDHINKYLYAEKLHYFFNAGRIVMPLFVFVLAYNLSRPGAKESGAYIRTSKRLAVFGLLATPAFVALGGLLAGWWPLNVMFALMVMVITMYLIEQKTLIGKIAACMTFLGGGMVVEFWWPAIILGLAVWSYCKAPSVFKIVLALIALVSLRLINGNYWALAAIPVIALAGIFNTSIPRSKWVFYTYYPIHLTAIWAVSFSGVIHE